MIDAEVLLVDPADDPGRGADPRRVASRSGRSCAPATSEIGVLVGHLPATRPWERADQDLLELFASEVAVAIRNAQLFAQVEAQNAQLLELDAAKDDFLRGVSHNLQTPADEHPRLRRAARRATSPDRRLGIIAEQADRLSRMVRQLLTVTRLESGTLKPRGRGGRPRPRGSGGPGRRSAPRSVPFTLDDQSRRLARRRRRRPARPGPVGAARQRREVRRTRRRSTSRSCRRPSRTGCG